MLLPLKMVIAIAIVKIAISKVMYCVLKYNVQAYIYACTALAIDILFRQ